MALTRVADFALREGPLSSPWSATLGDVSIQVVQAGLACCGVEAAAVDLVESALDLAPTDQAAASHILVIAGTITQPLAPVVKASYDQLNQELLLLLESVPSAADRTGIRIPSSMEPSRLFRSIFMFPAALRRPMT